MVDPIASTADLRVQQLGEPSDRDTANAKVAVQMLDRAADGENRAELMAQILAAQRQAVEMKSVLELKPKHLTKADG